MDIICGLSGIVSSVHPAQGITDIIRGKFQNLFLDLSRFCSPRELENTGILQKEIGCCGHSDISQNQWELAAVLDQCRKSSLLTSAVRAPYLLRNTKRTDIRELLFCLSNESIRICGKAECGTIIIRPPFFGLTRQEQWRVNRDFYLRLVPSARENHVRILLENQCRDMNGHLIRGICSDPDEAALWVDQLNDEAGEEQFGFSMDTGACNICGQNMQDFVHVLGSRIKAVILRDNDGQRNLSALPFTYTSFDGQPGTDWLGLIRGLREIDFDGQMILDFADTATSFSPVLRPVLIKLAKATADYFEWQIRIEHVLKKYTSIVLFGAGNMCRNYMKCYGEKYPPLFTCDNDSRIWGTNFCGLEVKSPDSLKTLPGDCAIFICNIYYREIERQLKDMGIKNNIEFFNDEYMPSFYFDRLERR